MKKIILPAILFFSFISISFSQRSIPMDQLTYAKKNIHSIPNGNEALKSLIKEADKALTIEITPVTEKSIIAASGDKHDYVSMGPYWWPDPNKPDGLPYIRRDGERNPEIYKLDRYKLDKLFKNIVTLGYAYFFTGEEKYAEKAVGDIRLWFLDEDTKMNPNMNFGQMVPGHTGGKGRAEGMIDTYGFVRMVDCITLLSSSNSFTKKDMEGIKKWFSDFLDWMLTSEIGQDEYNAKNNHGMAFDVQATAYALFSGRNDIASRFIKEFPENRIFKQVEPDGSQPLELVRTIAFHYTLFNIAHMMDMSELAKYTGVDLFSATSPDGRSISKAIEFIKPYLGQPQSAFPYKQIKEWDENQQKLCWILRRATFFKPNQEYDKLFGKYNQTSRSDRQWLLYAK